MIKQPSHEEICTSLLQFFALNAADQLAYAYGIPPAPEDIKNAQEITYPFGLEESPLLTLATSAASYLPGAFGETVTEAQEQLTELGAILALITSAQLPDLLFGHEKSLREGVVWNLVRKMSLEILRKLQISQRQPIIRYEELIPWIVD
jgi:hypothetical protein